MPTNNSNAYRLSIYIDKNTDKDIIQWCNENKENVSAAFRELFHNQKKYSTIMHELHEIKAAISAISAITPLDTATPKPTRKRSKPQVDPDILAALDNI